MVGIMGRMNARKNDMAIKPLMIQPTVLAAAIAP